MTTTGEGEQAGGNFFSGVKNPYLIVATGAGKLIHVACAQHSIKYMIVTMYH